MFQSLLHPRHVPLTHEPSLLHPLITSVAHRLDPYYDYNHLPLHPGASLPRFNVIESETSYVLIGEFPGVGDRTSINVVWLPNHTLVVEGSIEQDAAVSVVSEAVRNASDDNHQSSPGRPIATFPRFLLHERHIGPFSRSFSFPVTVDETAMEASLKDGLLKIVVPKSVFAPSVGKKVYIQSSTG